MCMEMWKHVQTYIEFDIGNKSTVRMLVARRIHDIASSSKINILESSPGSPFLIYQPLALLIAI